MERTEALAAVFEPVHPPTTFEETVERLGTAIRLGLLPAGTRLPPERELAARFHISRSTLRQALTTLVQSGHLVALRGRSGGTFVAASPPLSSGVLRPGEAGMRAVLDHRVAIETGAAVLAAERADAADLERMTVLVERMASARTFADYRRADVRFHIALAEGARSPRLVALMTEVQGEMTDLVALIAHPEQVLIRSNAQHQRLVVALGRREVGRAVRLVREHLAGTEHILAGLMPMPRPAPVLTAKA